MTRRTLHREALLASSIALIAACGRKNVRVAARPSGAPSIQVPAGTTERGIASWYGKPYHGRPAADGEIYDMEQLVAAHRTLPFQTRVAVRNLTTGKTVEVRIIDRGPFVDGRIIDLSHKAAQEIEMIGSGIAQVEITVLSAPASATPAEFGVQVGAFRDKANADRMERTMITLYGAGRQAMRAGDPPFWRVLAGAEPSPEAAEVLARRIRGEQNVPQAFVVRLDP